MRPDAVFDCVQGVLSTGLSLLFLLILPLSAFIYCSAGKVASVGRDKAPSDKSVSGTRKSKVSKPPSDTAPPPPAASSTAAVDPNDNRTKWAATTVETSPTTVSKEFVEQLKSYAAPGRTHEAFDANIDKNRYNDIPCYDQDRIVLKTSPDYINANYMKAPDGVIYIATQGPLTETRCDFWQMIVQEEVNVILQLCKFIEGSESTEKCAEYWPSGEKETTTVLDKFTIKKIDKSEEIAPGTVKTKLEVKGKTITRTVQHIFCDAWPDQLAPNDPATIIKIWNYVKANRGAGPIVVHCSAGVGRTATFIGLSYGVEMLKKEGACAADIVKEMRKCRHKAVQTHIQYGFLHAALLEMFMQMNLTPRSPQSAVFLETFRKQVDRAIEKKEKTERSAKQRTHTSDG